MNTKEYDALSADLVRASNHADVAAAIDRFIGKNNPKVSAAVKALQADGGSLRGVDALAENKAVGCAPSPLHISVDDYKSLWEATKKRLPSFRLETKAPFGESNFVSGGLPPALLPQQTLQLPYEPDRPFEHFKVQAAPNASAVEYLQHVGNANPAAAVAELGTKPDLGMEWTTVTTSFTKIAALASFSMEALQDFDYFQQIVPVELFAAIVNAESNEVINGSGSAPHMVGILNQPNILTRAIGSDTPVDCLRKSFNDLRTGTAFARANLVLTHPTTWAEIQLQKAEGGLYLLNPTDPNAIGDMDNIFGVRVIQNSMVPAGTAIVFDTNKAVLSWIRQAMTLDINSYGDDEFQKNYVTYRAEERVAIGVMYPQAICAVTGLPSS